jgi:hypothetical protein
MKTFITFIGLIIGTTLVLQAQSLDRFVIGTTGGFATNSAWQLEFTAGEVATTTLQSGNFVLNQGFQQTNPPYNTKIEAEQIQVEYSLYPNPTTSMVYLELSLEKAADIRIEILDIRGRKTPVPDCKLKAITSVREEFDLSQLATGMYLIRIYGTSGEISKTFRIEKLD